MESSHQDFGFSTVQIKYTLVHCPSISFLRIQYSVNHVHNPGNSKPPAHSIMDSVPTWHVYGRQTWFDSE